MTMRFSTLLAQGPLPVVVIDNLVSANVAALMTDLMRIGCDMGMDGANPAVQPTAAAASGIDFQMQASGVKKDAKWRVCLSNATFRLAPNYPEQVALLFCVVFVVF